MQHNLANRTKSARVASVASDVELGRVIRTRREARGLSQGDFASRVGLTAFVVGRIEAGARPVRAVELVDIARELGTSADDLLRWSAPPTTVELVEAAERSRDAAYAGLKDYAESVLVAAAALDEEGVVVGKDDQLDTADDLADYLRASMLHFAGVTAPQGRVELIERVLSDLTSVMRIYPATDNGGDSDD